MALTSISHGGIRNVQAAEALKAALISSPDSTGKLIFGWPIGPNTAGTNGAFVCDAVLVSNEGQVTVFDLTEETTPLDNPNYKGRQDHAYNLVMAHLMAERSLTVNRRCCLDPRTITFAPNANTTDPDHPETPVVNGTDLLRKVAEFQKELPPSNIDPETVYNAVLGTW